MTKYADLSLEDRAVVDGLLEKKRIAGLREYRVCDLLNSAHTEPYAKPGPKRIMERFELRGEKSIRLYDLTVVEMDGVETNAWLRERWTLGERYHAVVGYNPFEDDPTQTNKAVAIMLAEVEELSKAVGED